MNKKKILLFQKYLRSHILNFQKELNNFKFVLEAKEESTKKLYERMISYESEINRTKSSFSLSLRRLIGVPNVRLKLVRDEDMSFTYGCLLLTNKPYCVYIENGLGIYKYDSQIAQNPLACLIASFLIRRKNCKRLIFMSEAAQKSFLYSANYSQKTKKIIRKKSAQCYPLVKSKLSLPKKPREDLKLLFIGTFYMKGGIEIINAFEKVRKKHRNVSLTVITQVRTIKKSHLERMKKMDGLEIHDAVFNKKQIDNFYKSHDVFLSPTYRDSFGMILMEVLPFGMPIVGTDQYATREMIIGDYNGFLFPNHPLKDYDEKTYKIFGKYRNPRDLYLDLFSFQENRKMKIVEEFLYNSIEKFILDKNLFEKFSKNSIELYKKKFDYKKISSKIESIFEEALK